ncbi:MAG: Eco29kI family restriction endonuclease [Pseudonocardiaceae bacterium]
MISSQPFGAAADFKLSITQALADQLAERLRPLRPAPLNESSLERVENRSGVYELFLANQRVYVGKASNSLPARLRHHARKLSGRTGLSLADVSFICLYVDEDLEAAAPETLLIKKYRNAGGSPWNTNGFGIKDPGRRRDTTEIAADHFDAVYPINLSTTVEITSGARQVGEFLAEVKTRLPYNLRYERTTAAARHNHQASLHIESPALTARQIAELVVNALPVGWQLTALPGYAILYKETIDYETALAWWRRTPSGVVETTGPAHTTPPTRDQPLPSEHEEREEEAEDDDDPEVL